MALDPDNDGDNDENLSQDADLDFQDYSSDPVNDRTKFSLDALTPPGSPQSRRLFAPAAAQLPQNAPSPLRRAPGATAIVAPSQTPTTSMRPQTESANPLTGDSNDLPGGSSQILDHGRALGYTQRGASSPGGTAALAGSFDRPSAASTYQNFARKLFNPRGATPGRSSGMTPVRRPDRMMAG